MVKKIFLICICFGIHFCNSQNFVPNHSFEDTIQCPDNVSQMHRCLSWGSYSGATPDYYHTCSSNQGMSPPSTYFGYQAPFQGNAYGAVIAYSTTLTNYRELIVTPLISPLQQGTWYHVSFHVTRGAAIANNISSNKLGVRFSTLPFTFFPAINNFAHVYTDSILTDSTNWIEVSGSFIADSNYTHIIIGNFFDDSHTNIINSDFSTLAYYFIDNVCVKSEFGEFSDCNIPLHLPNYEEEVKVEVYPNPFSKEVKFSFSKISKIQSLKLYNGFGEIIKSIDNKVDKELKIPRDNLSPGFYYFLITIENGKTVSGKIIID